MNKQKKIIRLVGFYAS